VLASSSRGLAIRWPRALHFVVWVATLPTDS
jgi:hypothetical protein